MTGIFKNLSRKNDGVVAVEFAMVTFPFIVMITGILEISMMFATSIVIEGSAAEAARLVRTGAAQGTGNPQLIFEDEFCALIQAIVNCNDVQYEVIAIEAGTFGAAGANEPEIDAEGNLVPQAFDAGESNSVVLIRTYYKYEFLTPLIGEMMTGEGEPWVPLMSTSLIKNEPYEFGT